MLSDSFDIVLVALRRLTPKSGVMQGGALVDRLIRETKLDAATIRTHFKEMRVKGLAGSQFMVGDWQSYWSGPSQFASTANASLV